MGLTDDGARADGARPRGQAIPSSGRRSSRPPENDAEPTILLVGAEQSFHTAIAEALAHHGVYVETSPAHGVVETVVATAPDLVLLVGEAAADAGSGVLASLHTSPHSSVVPVAILADDTALGERLRGFRHGAAAVIPRSASVDAMADQLAKLAREIPDREREALGNVGEATLKDLVDALSKELRSGILSIRSGRDGEDDAVRVVLGGGRPLAQTIDEFVARIRKHVVHAEPLRYEFDERAGGTVQLLGGEFVDAAEGHEDVSGLRVVLADGDAARADAVAQALRQHQATVVVADFDPPEQRFARLHEFDPAILMIDEPSLRGNGYTLIRRMRRDTRLRWASLLVVRWEDVWSEETGAPAVEPILGTLATLAEPEHTLAERVEVGAPFDTRLEITGPARLLRRLAACPYPLRVTVFNPRLQVRVDFSDELVAGARAVPGAGGPPLDGATALAALLVLSSGRVHVERRDEAELVNIMSTVDVALNLADVEGAPIQPSLPAPEGSSEAPSAADMLSLPPPARRARSWGKWLLLPGILVGAGLVAAVVIWLSGAAPRQPATAPAASAAPAPVPSEGALAASASKAKPKRKKPKKAEPKKPKDLGDLAAAALKVESQKNLPECEELVGPSWSLLSGDQPARAAAEVRAGRRALIVGKLDEAQVAFCRATVLDSMNADAFTSLIRVYLMRRDPKKARAWAERAAKHHPNDAEIQRLYGDTLARVGEPDEAVRIWLSSVGVKPDDPTAVRGVAFTYATAGLRALEGSDYAQADRLLRRSALLDPSSARSAAGLGRALVMQGEYRAALAWTERAIELEPRDAEIRILLGDIHDKLGHREKAFDAWRLAYEIEPENKRAYARYGRIPISER